MCVQVSPKARRVKGCFGAGVIGAYEPPDMGTGN